MKVVFKHGNKEKLPNNLIEGEVAFCTDTKEFFIGTSLGNVLFTRFDLLAMNMEITPFRGNHYIGLTNEGYEEFMNEL